MIGLACLLAIGPGEHRFGSVRLLAYGLFLHTGLLLAGVAVLWWRRSRRAALVSAAACMLLELVAIDAFLIEPHWIEVTHVRIANAKLTRLGEVKAELLVAGHTHGGQVRLPWLGPIMTQSRVPRSWAAGVTKLGPAKTLIVSRGIGMERAAAPRLRFLCRPQIVVVDLVPQ